MSIESGIIAAAMINARNNISEAYSSNSSKSSGVPTKQWNELVHKYEILADDITKALMQIQLLMVFINAGRIALGKNLLTFPVIRQAIESDENLSELFNYVRKVGRSSRIGYLSRAEDYWQNINRVCFDDFSHAMHSGSSANSRYFNLNVDRILDSQYGQISGYQKVHDDQQSILRLVEDNKQTMQQKLELMEEVERLEEENAQLRAQLEALQQR